MAKKIFGPRKQRTRQHVIADLAVHHVEGFVLEEGHTVQRMNPDYGYDLALFTYDGDGYIEPDSIFIQVKSAERLKVADSEVLFDLDIRDYNLWMREKMPVVLILFDAFQKRAYWLNVQHYFHRAPSRKPQSGARNVRVRVPMKQLLDRQAVAKMRGIKWEGRRRLMGEPR